MELKDISGKLDNPYYEVEASKALEEYRTTGYSQTINQEKTGLGLYEQIEDTKKLPYNSLIASTGGWTAGTITYGGYDSIDSKQSEINDLKDRVAELERSVALLLARKIINE